MEKRTIIWICLIVIGFMLSACGTGGTSGSEASKTATGAPSAPTGVAVSASGANQVTVSWQPVSGATSYDIYWTNDPTHVMASMGATQITGVASPYHHTNLAAGTVYAYVVTALNASGESIESSIASATTPALDGVALYAANCASCHGSLATSAKKGRTASQIQAAINGGMGALSNLTTAQVQAIADVLAW
jgi:mono/diheme cytochrome c family protein